MVEVKTEPLVVGIRGDKEGRRESVGVSKRRVLSVDQKKVVEDEEVVP
jgi:predicted component of type VI protein secretion system